MVGAGVLMALGVIFIPVLLDGAGQEPPVDMPAIPTRMPTPEPLPLKQTPITLKGKVKSALSAADKQPSEPVIAGTDTGDLSAWVVQLGSFKQKSNAEKLLKKLKAEGYSAFIETINGASGSVYRVRVGPEMTQKKANNIRQRIAKKHAIQGKVMRYRGTTPRNMNTN